MCWHPNTFPQEMIHGESPANALLPLAPGTTIEAASPHPKPHQSVQTSRSSVLRASPSTGCPVSGHTGGGESWTAQPV